MATNHAITIERFPEGVPEESNFGRAERPMPEPADDELLVRNVYLSLDPFLRGIISGRQIYATPLSPGDTMPGNTVSQVVQSRADGFKAGDYVQVSGGWQQFAAVTAADARRVDPGAAPLSTAVGVLGMPGLTAYAGLLRLADPQAGETVLVSAAAGPVGSTVGQIAKIRGARAVGIAGSDEKCRLVSEHFGFDACINYKTEDLREAITAHCPDGVNVYFDNVGGTTLEAAIANLAIGARVTLCGLISQYNEKVTPPGPNLGPVIGKRAILKGFVVYDHYDLFDRFQSDCQGWLREGRLRILEDRAEGLDAAPAAFCRLMRGENVGKALVVVAPEQA